MSMEAEKSKIVSSIFWKFLERGGTQAIQFIVQIILARLLFPEEYGLIALVAVFISVANIFVQSGFSTALVQKKESDEVDFSSVFYLNLLVAILLYTVLFLISPFLASFFREPQLTPVLRILSLTIMIGAINSIQNAYITKHMIFKKLFFSSLGAIIVSGVVGISTAYMGWGVWALVSQQMVNQIVVTIILWFTVKWRPKLFFSIERLKYLFSYGWKLLVSSLLDSVANTLSTLVIGKTYDSDMLGFYNRGQQFTALISTNVNGSIQAVLFPALASHQENRPRVKSMMRRAITGSSFIMFPLMIGLAVIAEPLIVILLTDKWLPVVPFLQISCAAEALIPIHSTNLQAINALGRSDIFLKLEIVKTVIGLVVLGICIPFGIYAMAWGFFLGSVIVLFINVYPNKKLLNYSFLEQWKDMAPSLVISLLMGAIIYPLSLLNIAKWQLLIGQIITGAVVYIYFSKIFKVESYYYFISTMKEILKSKKH